MDPNQAVIDVGAQLKEARDNGTSCAHLVARDGEIIIVGRSAVRPEDIPIGHLSTKDLGHGLSSAKWNHIEDRIRVLILKGVL